MAFFFLFTGLLFGATMIALTESERNYYYDNRMYMTYIGNKDGADIYRDHYTGQYYVDDGWDVRRIGTPGFVPHPIDKERLRGLCQKYNPNNLPWVDFLLAVFEGREDQLWTNFFDKYELGPKPKEPTWGKGIRKSRWAQYETDLVAYEQKVRELTPKFKEECRQWNEKRKQYNEEHSDVVSAAASQQLLRRALSGGATIIQVQPPIVQSMLYKAVVPQDKKPGDQFMVTAGGQTFMVIVPRGALPGTEIQFQGPALPSQVVQNLPVAQAAAVPPTSYNVPAALAESSATGSTRNPPPPAIKALNEPPVALEKKSSMTW